MQFTKSQLVVGFFSLRKTQQVERSRCGNHSRFLLTCGAHAPHDYQHHLCNDYGELDGHDHGTAHA